MNEAREIARPELKDKLLGAYMMGESVSADRGGWPGYAARVRAFVLEQEGLAVRDALMEGEGNG